MESVIRDAIVNHLETNKLIADTQHGFRNGRSCLTNLLSYLELITKNIDEGNIVDAVYLDFAKAFDKVPHQRLLLKLKNHGISGNILQWISSWLYNRRQCVQLKGSKSEWLWVSSGVPQGSVLGPVLFLIFINDFGKDINGTVLKFADDSKLFGKANSVADCKRIQDDLDKLKQWSDIWQMQFNVDKCKAIHFGAHNTKFTYNIDGIPLENTETERDLGIIVSDTLKSTDQCAAAYNKANRILGLIKRTVVSRDPSILVALYKSLVRPHLEFCCSAWSPHYKKDRTLIERIQHRFTRLFKDLQKLDYSERLNHLGLWTLEERRNRADLIEVFKLCKGQRTNSCACNQLL